MKRHRWNAIGRTRRRLAEILTAAINEREPERWAPLGGLVMRPERLHPMRLAGKARIWEDAHSWEGTAESRAGGSPILHVFSYDSMTEIVKAGGVDWVGKDGECVALTPADRERLGR
jgi:hypothetical protein